MSFNKTLVEINVDDPMMKRVNDLLIESRDILFDGEDTFLTGSFFYYGEPDDWDKDHDIDVVFRDDWIDPDLREWLYEQYGEAGNEEYDDDLSVYFRCTDGQVYNFITLKDEKFDAWKLATRLVRTLCRDSNELRKTLLENRAARVDIFVACETMAGVA